MINKRIWMIWSDMPVRYAILLSTKLLGLFLLLIAFNSVQFPNLVMASDISTDKIIFISQEKFKNARVGYLPASSMESSGISLITWLPFSCKMIDDMIMGPNGYLYISDTYNNQIIRVSRFGTDKTVIMYNRNLYPSDLAFDSEGNLIFTTRRKDSRSKTQGVWIVKGADPSNPPERIIPPTAFNDDFPRLCYISKGVYKGDLLLIGAKGGAITRAIAPDFKDIVTFIPKDKVKEPADAVILADGSVLVSDFGGSKVLHFTERGDLIGTFTTHISKPNKMHVDSDGLIYIADSVYGGRSIQILTVWTPEGENLLKMPIDAIHSVAVWEPPNKEPNAIFTVSAEAPVIDSLVDFNATDSIDIDGYIVDYKWNFGDGYTARGKTVTHTFTRSGTFIITLTVTDDDSASASASKTITVHEPNKVPVARFTWAYSGARLSVEPYTQKLSITFDASKSYDPDGKVVTYSWDWDSNGVYDDVSDKAMISHVFTMPGKHWVTLRVTDDKGATAKLTKTLTIGEKQPQASFTYLPEKPSIFDTVQFTDDSSDSDGQVVSWKWDFGDGTTSTLQNPTHKYAQKKTYTVKLTVTDNDGHTNTATTQVTVINLQPTVAFTFTPNQPYIQQSVSFDASSSADKDGIVTSYTWDFGDGNTAIGETISHAFTEEGTYTVKLIVTDNDGDTASHAEKIIVKAIPPAPKKFNNEWGLVVGIADYQDPSITDLKFTENDAQAFYNFLVDCNGGGFLKDHVRLLLGEQATLVGIRKGLAWLSQVASADDLVIFYYAGHGTVVPDKDHDEAKIDPQDTQDECLVPYNADYRSLTATTLVDDEIGYWFSNLTSKYVLIVFDSCFSGGASREARTFSKAGSRAAAENQVFTDMAGAGKLFLAASQANQSSFENGLLTHGVFTYFLLRGLGDKTLPAVEGLPPITGPEADKDGDGRVTVEEMKDYLDEKVPPFVREHEGGGEQTPVLRGDEGLRNLQLNGYGTPLIGEVTAIQGKTVIISLGSRHGIQPGDQFQVIRPLTLPDGSIIDEVEATIEVLYILGPDRAACRIIKGFFPIEVKDTVRPLAE